MGAWPSGRHATAPRRSSRARRPIAPSSPLPAGWFLKSALYQGRDVADLPLELGAKDAAGSVDPLKYQQHEPLAAAASDELLTLKLRYKEPDGDSSKLLTTIVKDLASAGDNLRFASALAEFGMLLTNSEHKGQASYAQLAEILREVKDDAHGDRAELKTLVARACELSADKRPGGTR